MSDCNKSDLIPCEKCGTTVHVGVAAKSHGPDRMHLCLDCLHSRKNRYYLQFNLWSVIDAQRFVP